ncbi:hypothetical protein RMCBS344292_08250 [Rhizopus microsporus]|nr:hypothetical protein RMCBS344292_08250 [Rhizopus microsporus]
MKLLLSAVTLLLAASQLALADFIPELGTAAPTHANIKEQLLPPEGSTLYDVWYAKGNRIYQCNPEKKGFQHWYAVQTHAFLYPTKGLQQPFDTPGKEIGQLSVAPLDPNNQMANPLDTIPVIYYYPDGSWAGTARPLVTTSMEKGRNERGDGKHLDDHIVGVTRHSLDGYLSHAKYIVRLNTLEGVAPPAEQCTTKGAVVNKPFTAYFMFYTDSEGVSLLAEEKVKWERMIQEYAPKN